jgi:hypothetical protein
MTYRWRHSLGQQIPSSYDHPSAEDVDGESAVSERCDEPDEHGGPDAALGTVDLKSVTNASKSLP